jgi:AraC-like DNA-binding protein
MNSATVSSKKYGNFAFYLYILPYQEGPMPPKEFVPGFLLQQGAPSPLGRISWSGFANDPQGQSTLTTRSYGTYALVYLLDGAGDYADARGRTASLHPGDLILTFPDIPRRYGAPANAPWREFYIIFDGPIFDLWRERGLLDDTQPICHLEPIDYWLPRLVETVEMSRVDDGNMLARVCALQQVLAEIFNDQKQRALGHAERTWLSQAYALLEQMSLSDRPNYAPLLSALDLSYAGFRNRFTRLAGLSPGRHLAKLQVRQVCDLLGNTDFKLRQIAERCGFTDEFHLSRRFKQLMGITPREFRRRMSSGRPRASDHV